MVTEAVEAGLDSCDLRLRYEDNQPKTSTPTKERICSSDNIECWDDGYNEPSNIVSPNSDPVINPVLNVNGDLVPQVVEVVAENSGYVSAGTDYSYGGAWGRPPSSPRPRPRSWPGTSSSPPWPGYFDYGISVFDQTPLQVLSDSFKGSRSPQILSTKEKVKRALRNSDCERLVESKSILETKVCHIKTKTELRAEALSNPNNMSDFRTETLRILTNNIRGFYSKRETLEAILVRENIDIVCLSETLMAGNRFPEIKGFSTYFRNRITKGGGGVALMIRDEKAKYAVRCEVGSEDNEFIVIKITNCRPHLVMIVYYGCQEKMGVDLIKLHISQLLSVAAKYTTQGCHVNITGDFNLKIGNEILKKNHEKDTPTGRLFMDQLQIHGLSIMNTMSDDPITFIDRSGKDHTRVVLDLVISNKPDAFLNFKTDSEKYEFTPYSIHKRKGVSSRTYADHMSIVYEIETLWQDRVTFKREPLWNYKEKLGDVKFDLFTSNACNFLMSKVEAEPSIDKVHKAFCKVITKGKFQSYGKRTLTASKLRRVNDELVWKQRLSDIDKLQKQFQEDKETNQIYKTRKSILAGQKDKQNVAVEVEETGEVLEDLDEVLDHVLQYNVTNMQKIEPSKQVEEVMKRKAAVIDLMLDDNKVKDFPSEIPWSIYLKVVKKVLRQKKACFRDFIKSGRNFKYAVFKFLNRMYSKEEFPEICALTYLTKIWKRKGSRARLKNNRFIHGKECFSKLLEKCVVAIIEEKLDQATPQLQAGSRKGRSTRDQMLKVIVMQKYHECKSRPLPILLVDVQACFDKMVLDDVIYDTIEAGADLKATRVARKFTNKTEIRLTGDPRNNGKGVGRVIWRTLGQGSNFAPPGIGLTTSKSLQDNFKDIEHVLAKIGNVTADPQSYVDDMATMLKDEKAVGVASQRIGRALEVISLKSHPDKTEVIVSGRSKKAAAVRENLVSRPALMQGNPVKVSKSGMYLGMVVSEEGHRATVDLTIRHRVAKSWGRVADIKSTINDSRMYRLGWLRAAVVLIRSVVIPSMTYSADVWIAMNKVSEKFLIDEFKSMVYVILDIPTHTKWTSVLADLGIPNIMTVVDKLRMNYISHTLWGTGDEKLRDMLEEEHEINPGNSLLSMANSICDKYNMPKVSETELDKVLVKRQARIFGEIEIWLSNVMSPVTQNVGLERMRLATNFFKLSKRESQALIAFNAGAFRMKTSWGDFHDNKSCLARLCGGLDDLEHIKRCPHYETKWAESFDKDCLTLAKYLVAVDRERRRRWKGESLF